MRQAKARIVLRTMAGNRGPGSIVAVINDAANIGASTYYNSPGEMYFTLPIDHPQAGEVEPWRRHYAVQENVRGVWKQRYEGLIVDFDANDTDVVFYGMDYLGLLDKVIDGRFVVGEPDAPPPEGSKHVDKAISSIIKDLIDYARNKTNSPVGFIPRGSFDTFSEKITIHSTLAAVGAFVQGLIESHRQGTGKRSRLYVRRDSATAFKFVLSNNPGTNRKGIRLTYGGMVQGFNIIGFGDFASRAYGIGRTLKGSELFYKVAGAPGTSPSHYGSIETVDFYDNVHDKNDLLRRVKQRAASMGRVGKRVAIGLKVDGLHPFDGFDIADSVIVDIKRGVIDTMRYGSGYWMIHGVEWRVFPDGHDELTLVVLPKEDGVAADKDLLVAQEVLPDPISVNDLPVITDPAKLGPDVVREIHVQDGAITDPKVKDLSADSITNGTFSIYTDTDPENPSGSPDQMVVFDSLGNEIGRWSSLGLDIVDANQPDNVLRLTEAAVMFSDDGGVNFKNALTAEGLNASAIGTGAAPGGHNRIPNAGFEMSVFTAPVSKVWTAAADWGASIVASDVAIDKSTADLKIAAGSF
jgi:hypothetical protein